MSQPDYLPLWATEDTTLPATGETNKVRPKESLRTVGWDMGQIPTAEEWNWMFNNVYLWVNYIVNEALPEYLPITGTQITFTGNITGTAEFTGNDQISVDLTSDLDSSTNQATANTLVKRDSSGGANFGYMAVEGMTVTDGITSEYLTVEDSATINKITTTSGNIDGTTIGSNTAAPGTFSTFQANNAVTLIGGVTSSGTNTWSGTQDITGNVVSSGANSFSGTQTVTGNIESSGTNSFSGESTFSGDITSTSANSFSGVNTFSNQLNLQSSSLSTNGYSYLPNGLIMQWGQVTIGTSNDTNVGASVTFPTAFPNAVFSTTANTTTRFFTTSDGYTAICACVNQSTTGFTVYVDSGNAEKLTTAQVINWLAIGH